MRTHQSNTSQAGISGGNGETSKTSASANEDQKRNPVPKPHTALITREASCTWSDDENSLSGNSSGLGESEHEDEGKR